MGKDVMIACDFSSEKELKEFLHAFGETRPFLKIGMELYYSEGPDLVRRLKAEGYKIFLDLKLHDIPNTVLQATRILSKLGVDMCNVHCAGGGTMMKAALEGANTSVTKVLAVTQLTSTSEEQLHRELLIDESMDFTVQKYAINAFKSGLAGVVCSTWEVKNIHKSCGNDFLTIVPGIRLNRDSVDDQVRVATPYQARKQGADYIVVGRSITKAANPAKEYEQCLKEFL